MGFRINCFTRRRRAGIALTEYLLGVGVASLAFTAIAAVSMHTGRILASLANYSEMQTTALNVVDSITKEVRQARSLTTYTSNSLTFLNVSNASVTFTYAPVSKTLTRTQGGTSKVLLTGCESLNFYVYERTPIQGTFDYNECSDTNEAKVVFLTWSCTRSIPGSKVSSDSAQTAKIVLRTN